MDEKEARSSAEEMKTSGEDCAMDENEKIIIEALQAVEKRGLSSKVEAAMNKAGGWMKKKLHQQSSSAEHILKLQDRIVKLKDGITPPGMKPFKLSYESTIFQEEVDKDLTFQLDIPRGTTIEKAKMRLYQQCNIWNTAMDLEVDEKRRLQLRESTSLRSFLKMCENATEELEAEKIDFAAEYDAPPGLFSEKMEMARSIATKKYKQLVEAEIEEKRVGKEKKEKAQTKEQDILERASKLQPMEVLEKWADDLIDKKWAERRRPATTRSTTQEWSPSRSASPPSSTRRRQKTPHPLGQPRGTIKKEKARAAGKDRARAPCRKAARKGKSKEGGQKGAAAKGSTKGKGKGMWNPPATMKGSGKQGKGKGTKSGGKGQMKSAGKGKRMEMWRWREASASSWSTCRWRTPPG